MLTRIIKEAPAELVNAALTELEYVNWDDYNHSSRASGVFSTSKTIHLRKHSVPEGENPVTINDYGKLVDTDETIYYNQFPESIKLANWIFENVKGIRMGRIMIVNLLPLGNVKTHIDPGKYFEIHSRFHVPLKTNEGVLFASGPESNTEHMPAGYLCQLNNRIMHGVENRSNTENRIHLIADIEIEGGNQVFS